MQFLNALAEAALASSAADSDVAKAAFISGALRELGVTLCMGMNYYVTSARAPAHACPYALHLFFAPVLRYIER
jgi:hypothetical protein